MEGDIHQRPSGAQDRPGSIAGYTLAGCMLMFILACLSYVFLGAWYLKLKSAAREKAKVAKLHNHGVEKNSYGRRIEPLARLLKLLLNVRTARGHYTSSVAAAGTPDPQRSLQSVSEPEKYCTARPCSSFEGFDSSPPPQDARVPCDSTYGFTDDIDLELGHFVDRDSNVNLKGLAALPFANFDFWSSESKCIYCARKFEPATKPRGRKRFISARGET